MSVPPSERGQIPLKDTLSAIRKLNEGKTKIIWETPNPNYVLIESKDDITAGDGERRHIISGKAALATETTANCFTYLNRLGIPTHFVGPYNETTFIAERAEMVKLESVARRIAYGSYLRRNPDVIEGEIFNSLRQEFFAKDDSRHDPLAFYRQGLWELHDAKKIMGTGHLGLATPTELGLPQLSAEDLVWMSDCTQAVFSELERAWRIQGVTLVDMKIEFGRTPDGKLKVADVIDNDSWRIWPGGQKDRMLDKQVYRDVAKPDPEALSEIKGNYARVAQMSSQF